MSGERARQERQARWSGYLLGFALGGFFDGILLHQILQWHHLLSGVEAASGDIGLLILADGLFHLLMYVLAALGLFLFWQGRAALAGQAGSRFAANLLLGFGAWHLADAILSHWLLGLHRIRMDSDNPLAWDLAWLGLFGLVPLVGGWLLLRRKPLQRPERLMASPWALALAVLVIGAAAARPQPSEGPIMVLFRPGMTPEAIFAVTQAAGARLIWTDPAQRVWALDLPEGANAARFYLEGALLVSNSILPAGCLDWMEPARSL